MTKVTTNRPIKTTPRENAEILMASYAGLMAQKREMEQQFKDAKAPLEQKLTEMESQLQLYAQDNVQDFEGKKTLELENGTIGWKLSPGSLNFALEADKEAYERLIMKSYKDAVETKVNPTIVIRLAKNLTKMREDLAKVGVTVVQEDKFFVSPNK